VPVDNAGNNYGQTQKALFDKIDIPTKNIHRVRSDLEPAQAAIDYAHTLNQFSEPPLAWPRFDLVFLGMGEDGHTASLFPGSPVEVDSPTLAVNVQYQGSPANRVTLTQNVINSSRNVFFLVAGNTKAAMLLNVLKGEHRPTEVPAQRIAPQEGSLTWLIDKEAGSLL
jgi:6-phosphogluconolactonase